MLPTNRFTIGAAATPHPSRAWQVHAYVAGSLHLTGGIAEVGVRQGSRRRRSVGLQWNGRFKLRTQQPPGQRLSQKWLPSFLGAGSRPNAAPEPPGRPPTLKPTKDARASDSRVLGVYQIDTLGQDQRNLDSEAQLGKDAEARLGLWPADHARVVKEVGLVVAHVQDIVDVDSRG